MASFPGGQMKKEEPAREGRDRPEGGPKRPYHQPALTEYGSVTKLTQGSLTLQADGASGGFRMNCL